MPVVAGKYNAPGLFRLGAFSAGQKDASGSEENSIIMPVPACIFIFAGEHCRFAISSGSID
jgi:hypothetical protein